MAPSTVNLDTRRRWAVSHVAWMFTCRKITWYQDSHTLGDPQSQWGHFGK